MAISGIDLLMKALKAERVELLFGYPGAAVIPAFDKLFQQEEIRLVLPRHEQGLVHAADGYARASGKVGVCLVTSGPGATNIVTALATANFDGVPLVCFTGQVATGLIGNDAFQEVDIVGITRSITKHSVTVMHREDLARVIKEAFYIANSGRKGPVVVDLPVDVMSAYGEEDYPQTVEMRSYRPHTAVHIGQVKKAVALLKKARRPMILAGGGVKAAGAEALFAQWVEKMQVPVVTTIMGKGVLPADNPHYLGNLGMHGSYAANHAVMACDLLFSIGTRFNERITGRAEEFARGAKIVHIDIDAASISRNVQVDIPIVADAKEAMVELLKYAESPHCDPWWQQIRSWQRQFPLKPIPDTGKGLSPYYLIQELNRLFPAGVIVTDVGQHQMWACQFVAMNGDKRFLTSGGLGTMGYGLPAAIGAQLACPEQRVLCLSGDGGFQMNVQELATAVLLGLPVITVIFNNGYLGMVRQWQQIFYGRRYAMTDLHPAADAPYIPDFVRLAASYGALGLRVTQQEEFAPAFARALANTQGPTVIECLVDREALVLPMVKSGAALDDMILEVEEG